MAIFIVAVGVLSALFFTLPAFKKISPAHGARLFKIAALTLAAVFAVRYLLGTSALERMYSLFTADVSGELLPLVMILLDWFNIAAILILVCVPFFKLKVLSALTAYFVLPVAALNLIFFRFNVIALGGTPALTKFNARVLFYLFEEILLAVIALCYVLKTRRFKLTRREVGIFFLSLSGILLCTVPPYTLHALLGNGPAVVLKDLTFEHRVFIYIALIIPVALFLIFKNRSYEVKRFMCLFISIATLTTFSRSFLFSNFLSITGLPLHLCNTAMYIIPLCIIFKMNRLFYFTLFINVLGAFLAMAMPDYAVAPLFNQRQLVFWINHITAFFMPLLCVALGLFKRAKWKEFVYSMLAFGVYFFSILIINAWFTNYDRTIDYFFTNSNFIAAKAGKWAEDLRLILWHFNIGTLSFTLYPLYQFLFFIVYIALGFGIWFIYENAYAAAANWHKLFGELKQVRREERELKAARNTAKPEENKMLKIINFSKRYGGSADFAVNDISFEVNYGEVFGFLGPNGAGKSTLIKSIVGIQPITDGRIEVCGHDVQRDSVEAKRLIGFVPDHYALYEKLTGREYINYVADLYGVSREERDGRIQRYVDRFELNHAFDSQIKTYSHGMKQKITIISALVHNPPLWILDEPLTGLDPTSIFEVKEIMKAYAKAGNIVFFSSHIIDLVERICDRIAIIQNGKIVATVVLADLKKKKIKLESFYLKHIGEKGGERT
jgi:ABC-2 type transport system ATP-binding protein